MGVYDCIEFRCPNCGTKYIAQSKSGECTLASYPANAVPYSVAMDANRHAPFECNSCGKYWYFSNVPMVDNESKINLIIEAYEPTNSKTE